MKHTKYLLIIVIFNLRWSLYSTSIVYQTVDGSLSGPWRFNFTILADEFRGVILQSIDSNRSAFGMEVVQERGKEGILRMKYNEKIKVMSLKGLCGCDPCDGTVVHLDVSLSNTTMIVIRCNGRSSDNWPINARKDTAKDENKPNIVYPIPMKIVNVAHKIFIMIGNVGPYVGDNGVTIFPLKEQMVGCVDKFLYNDVATELIGNSSKVGPSCLWRCVNNICNGGLCKMRVNRTKICDCHTTPLNGQFCNRSLTAYSRAGGNNSYERTLDTKEIYLKMTWKRMLDKVYCLMEIVREFRHVTLWTNKSHLMIDSSVVSDIDVDGINFLTVTIVNDYLIVTSNNKESRTAFTVNRLARINIGFSEETASCEVFEGAYDVLTTHLRLAQHGDYSPDIVKGSIQKTTVILLCFVVMTTTTIIIMCTAFLTIGFVKRSNESAGNIYNEQPMEVLDSDQNLVNDDAIYNSLENYYVPHLDSRNLDDTDHYVAPSRSYTNKT